MVAQHREHFAAPDPRFPLSQSDVIIAGFPVDAQPSLPQWASVVHLDPFPDSEALETVARDYRLCCVLTRDETGPAGDLALIEQLLRHMAAGVQVVRVEGGEDLIPLLIQVARAVDPAMVVLAAGAGSHAHPHLREDRRLYSCEPEQLRDALVHPGEVPSLYGELTAASGLPGIDGIDPALPEDQQLWMRLATLAVRLAARGVPVLHWAEVLSLEQDLEALVGARSASAAFHPLSEGEVLASEPQLVALRRASPEGAVVLCLHNLSRDYGEYRHRKDLFPWPETGVLRELISGDLVVPTSEGALFSLELEPWESLWLSFSDEE